MDDNRQRYRTDVGGLELLDVRLILPGSGSVHGEVLDLSFEGIGARFDPDTCPRLPAGEPVKLALSMRKRGKAMVVSAVVQHRREEGEHRRYGFRFVDLDDLREKLDGPMLGLFNRRQVLRVRPDEDEPIAVAIAVGERALSGRTINLSELGMALSVPAGEGASPAADTGVRLTFRLPGTELDLEFGARVVYSQPGEGVHRWGVEFDAADLAREGVREALREFVLERRRAMVQQLECDAGTRADPGTEPGPDPGAEAA